MFRVPGLLGLGFRVSDFVIKASKYCFQGPECRARPPETPSFSGSFRFRATALSFERCDGAKRRWV